MPETRTEWALFTLGLAVIAALGLLVARHYTRDPTRHAASTSGTHPTTIRRPRVTTAYRATTAVRATTTVPPPPPRTTTRATTTTSAATTAATTTTQAAVELSFRALADTWLSVKRDSSTGPVLYVGTLTKGKTETFTGETFWVRFGGASNVSATLDGKPLRLPGGTYSAPITRAGLGTRHA